YLPGLADKPARRGSRPLAPLGGQPLRGTLAPLGGADRASCECRPRADMLVLSRGARPDRCRAVAKNVGKSPRRLPRSAGVPAPFVARRAIAVPPRASASDPRRRGPVENSPGRPRGR